ICMRQFLRSSLLATLVILINFAPSRMKAADAPDKFIYSLEDFGPLGKASESQASWQAARESLKDKSSLLIVPPRVWSTLKLDALQSLIRTPAAPAQTKQWRVSPG